MIQPAHGDGLEAPLGTGWERGLPPAHLQLDATADPPRLNFRSTWSVHLASTPTSLKSRFSKRLRCMPERLDPARCGSSIDTTAPERFTLRILQNTAPKGWVALTALLLIAIALPAPALVRSLVRSVPPSETPTSASGSVAKAEPARPAKLVHLPAGSRFDDGHPPAGWSHLVIKSTPFLASGDLDTLSEASFKTARRIRLTIVANVVRASSGRGHRLDRVGVGLSTPAAGGDDVIVTPRDIEGSKDSWSVADRIVLAAGEFELSRADLSAATPTLAVLRMPTTAVVEGVHKKVRLIYAFLIDPDSDSLRTFHWWEIDDRPARRFTEFKHPDVFDSPLDVQAKRLAGIPVGWSFAMLHAPKGIEREVTPELERLIAPDSIDSNDPGALEAALINAASRPPSPESAP